MLAQQPHSWDAQHRANQHQAKKHQPLDSVPVTDLPSRVTRTRLRASGRLDIFWELCTSDWDAPWAGRTGAEQLAANGRRLLRPYDLSVPREEAMKRLWGCRQGAPRFVGLRILAAIYHWHVLTTEQIASLVGTKSIEADLRALWQAGLVWQGSVAPRMLWTEKASPVLWRITPSVNIGRLLHEMTPWERLGVLAGPEWQPQVPHVVHDLVATDITLRAAELVPSVAAVYGERLSGADRLTGLPAGVTGLARGDAVWARSDGLRIVVELSTAAYKQGYAKAGRWARVLEADRSRSLFVLFVSAVHPVHRSHALAWSEQAYRRAVAEAAWSSVAAVDAGVPERMGVVSLADWAPAPMRVVPNFADLPVWRPTGPPGDRWQQADLADQSQVTFAPVDTDEALAPIRNAAKVYAMPWWLANPAGPS